jgi:hypothetical protein
MGRTKHFESDASTDFIRQSKRRKSVIIRGGDTSETPATLDAELMFRHLRTRIWRTALSLVLRMHALTRGFFKKNGMAKGVTLATFAYFLLLSENAWVVERRTAIFTPSSSGKAARTSMSVLNDAAPVAVDELAEAQAREYIERYAPVAVAEMKRYGIPASISLAQGLVESRAGHSTLAKKNNNHFGIKCFSRKCKKGHCSNHTDDTHKDFFRKFPSAWESWRAHSQMLANGRYVVLRKHGTNYKAWAEGLKELGYATDRRYDAKLIGMIQHYELDRFDR